LHEKSESGPKNLKKVYFQAQIGHFVVLTTMTSHTKTHMSKFSKTGDPFLFLSPGTDSNYLMHDPGLYRKGLRYFMIPEILNRESHKV
jgi:hypothetical protein